MRFEANHLQVTLHREALALLNNGVLTAEDLDAAHARAGPALGLGRSAHDNGPRWARRVAGSRASKLFSAAVSLDEARKRAARIGKGFHEHGPAADIEVRARIVRQFQSVEI